MRVPLLKHGVPSFVAALLLAGCTSSNPVPVTSDGLRSVVGTSLIGARGASAEDQFKINETVAGLCGGGVWTRSECAAHGRGIAK